MSDILERIMDYKRDEVAAAKVETPWNDIVAQAHDAPPPRGFRRALLDRRDDRQYGLIAEVKKASPSKGLIREDFDPARIARDYQTGGATCLSVLTDEPSFQGSPRFLVEARNATRLPVLRKDFMLETYQVVQSRALEADCILIILAAVGDDTARFLIDAAREWKMDALIEVHDQVELDRALALDADMIGINNRNLRTFETRLETTIDLAAGVGDGTLLISESGILDKGHLDQLRDEAGVTTFLVGESLMRQDDVVAATRMLMTGTVKA